MLISFIKKENFKKYIIYELLILISFAYALIIIPSDKFEISFLDVGQGDAIFIKTQKNKQILIDGGPSNVVVEKLNEVMPFFDRTIDLLILTHPDYDHLSGALEVLKRLDVKNVLMTGVYMESTYYDEFMKELKSKDINILIADSENDFKIDEVYFDILYPFENISNEKFDPINNSSIAILLRYKDLKIFLGGDIEIKIEDELINTYKNLDVDIYKASHHGSKTSSSLNFLQFLKPETVIIQVGKDNIYKHPSLSVLNNFAQVGMDNIYRTDIDGSIKIIH